MKTLCIKTNNLAAINYLLDNLKDTELDDVYFSCHKFKTYNNIFIHYKGCNLDLFLNTVCNLLVFLVLDVYEDIISNQILQHEYFYFDTFEKKEILNKLIDIYIDDSNSFELKEKSLFESFYNFFKDNNKLFLKGFITFRLKNYIEEVQKNIDTAVNQYIIEKEYTEFISLLKLYIKSEESKTDLVHLIYHNDEAILLDKNKNTIKTDINLLNAKYLSDISFSSCDMVLNTLLNIIPNKIQIHLVDDTIDEFITTIQLIFEDRVTIVNNYKINSQS